MSDAVAFRFPIILLLLLFRSDGRPNRAFGAENREILFVEEWRYLVQALASIIPLATSRFSIFH